jgi:hypothetical protein
MKTDNIKEEASQDMENLRDRMVELDVRYR